MKRLNKSKSGFTLVEIVIVIAIIIILASVATLTVRNFIDAGNSASDTVKSAQQAASNSFAQANQNFDAVGFN